MVLRFMTSGESHGPALVAILEGLPAGLALPIEVINIELSRRQQGLGASPRMKVEKDTAHFLGGVMAGQTTGAPLAMLIENLDHTRWRGHPIAPLTVPRPGHADLVGALKYGYRDLRPALERASARETTARVAVGAVCKHFLNQFNIHLGGYVSAIGEITADLSGIRPEECPTLAEQSPVRCPDPAASAKMEARIKQVIRHRDTLGGVLEVIAWGVPPGLGSYIQWDRRLDARLGAALLSVPAIKGVEIGPAFQNARQLGTQVHDPILLEGSQLIRPSQRNGGLEGGITTGQPICLRAAMKPVPTTLTPQKSVDLASGQETLTNYERSDFCPVPRAVPILEAMMAFVLAEALIEKLGGDSLDEMLPRFHTLRRAHLADLKMDGHEVAFWPAEDA
jgi:chorismate synthase